MAETKMSKLDDFLSRLHKVRKNGKDYMACCPAHKDGSPSLTIAEKEDGRILVYCFAGCETADVLAAVGMEMKDLMPENTGFHRRKPDRRPFNALDVLCAVKNDLTTALIVCKDIQAGKALTESESLAFARLVGRVGMAINLAGGEQ
jgi:hypothetical protein